MICPTCGYEIATGVPCPRCTSTQSFDVPVWAQPGGTRPEVMFRNIRGLSRAVIILMVAPALLMPATSAVSNSWSDSTAVLFGMVFVAVRVVMIVWLYRARRNVDGFGTAPRWSRGWTVGAWFIPIAQLIMIPAIVADVARNSAAPSQARRAATRVWIWGGLDTVFVTLVTAAFSILAFPPVPMDRSVLEFVIALGMAAVVTGIFAVVMQIEVIRSITNDQYARRARATRSVPTIWPVST